jgi:hypothetical protein
VGAGSLRAERRESQLAEWGSRKGRPALASCTALCFGWPAEFVIGRWPRHAGASVCVSFILKVSLRQPQDHFAVVLAEDARPSPVKKDVAGIRAAI